VKPKVKAIWKVELIKELQKTGKPIVILINAGRPLVFDWVADNMPTIVYTWWLGSEAGNAIADVLFGDYNPSGKLPMSFPRTEGQIPIYYNHFNTGRPAATETSTNYVSAYIDLKNSPKFPFGFGLSYTTFKYSDLKLSKKSIKNNETITVSVNITNTGSVKGEEVVQLYLRDRIGSVVRPIMELKDFQKITLDRNETKTIQFTIDNQKLSFYNNALEFVSEPGDFDLMIGSSSADIHLKDSFELVN
jgi:beta-glucosidase